MSKFSSTSVIHIYCPNLLRDIIQIPDYMDVSKKALEVFKFRAKYYSPNFIKSCGYYLSNFDFMVLQYHFLLSNLIIQSSNMSFTNFFDCEAREYVSSLDQKKFSKSLEKLASLKKNKQMISCILPDERGVPIKSSLPLKDFMLVALRAKYYNHNSDYFLERYISVLCTLIVDSSNYSESLKDYICSCKFGGMLDRKVLNVAVNSMCTSY